MLQEWYQEKDKTAHRSLFYMGMDQLLVRERVIHRKPLQDSTLRTFHRPRNADQKFSDSDLELSHRADSNWDSSARFITTDQKPPGKHVLLIFWI